MVMRFDLPVVVAEAETIKNIIGVKGGFDLGITMGSERNTRKCELSKQIVVLCVSMLTLVDLNEHTRLVIGVTGLWRKSKWGYFGFLGETARITLD